MPGWPPGQLAHEVHAFAGVEVACAVQEAAAQGATGRRRELAAVLVEGVVANRHEDAARDLEGCRQYLAAAISTEAVTVIGSGVEVQRPPHGALRSQATVQHFRATRIEAGEQELEGPRTRAPVMRHACGSILDAALADEAECRIEVLPDFLEARIALQAGIARHPHAETVGALPAVHSRGFAALYPAFRLQVEAAGEAAVLVIGDALDPG